jgi:hypothetical protein
MIQNSNIGVAYENGIVACMERVSEKSLQDALMSR